MSLTGRPSSPPLALISSSQIFMPTSACLPFGASGPVSDIEKPILIGSPCWAEAGTAGSVKAAKAEARKPTVARRFAVIPGSMASLPAGASLSDPAFWRDNAAIMKSAARVVHPCGAISLPTFVAHRQAHLPGGVGCAPGGGTRPISWRSRTGRRPCPTRTRPARPRLASRCHGTGRRRCLSRSGTGPAARATAPTRRPCRTSRRRRPS